MTTLQRDPRELYRIGALLFAAATFATFIVLFLLIIINPGGYAFAEATDLILGITLLIFTLLFSIALALTERRVRLSIAKKETVKA